MQIHYRNGFVIVTAKNALGETRTFQPTPLADFKANFGSLIIVIRRWQRLARAALIEQAEGASIRG